MFETQNASHPPAKQGMKASDIHNVSTPVYRQGWSGLILRFAAKRLRHEAETRRASLARYPDYRLRASPPPSQTFVQ